MVYYPHNLYHKLANISSVNKRMLSWSIIKESEYRAGAVFTLWSSSVFVSLLLLYFANWKLKSILFFIFLYFPLSSLFIKLFQESSTNILCVTSNLKIHRLTRLSTSKQIIFTLFEHTCDEKYLYFCFRKYNLHFSSKVRDFFLGTVSSRF